MTDDSIDLSRRQIFRRFIADKPGSVRLPPWATVNFFDRCDRCDKCIHACEEKILFRGDGGFPNVTFVDSGCIFCADCLSACPTGALQHEAPTDNNAWKWTARIKDNCLSLNGITCRSCGDACDESLIRFSLRLGGRAVPEIDSEKCTGCGFCIGVCPVKAIDLVDEALTGDT